MKITLTVDEVRPIVESYFRNQGIKAEFDIEVSSVAASTAANRTKRIDVVSTKDDVADLLDDVKPAKKRHKKKSRKHTTPGQGIVRVPKEPKVEYTKYAEIIEEFLNSNESSYQLDPEPNLKGGGLLYRYRIAAEMFGYRSAITLNCSRKDDTVIMRRRSDKIDSTNPKAYIK